MAAINDPGGQLRQPQVIWADQLLGGGGGGVGYCTTVPRMHMMDALMDALMEAVLASVVGHFRWRRRWPLGVVTIITAFWG